MIKTVSSSCRAAMSALVVGVVAMTFSTSAIAHSPGNTTGIELVVIGATSRTADELIPQALWRGHSVIAVARRPHAVRFAGHDNLTTVKADVRDRASIAAALAGHDDAVVISLFGSRDDPEKEVATSDLMTVGIGNIIEAMKVNGNQRLFATSSASVQEMPNFGYTADTPRPDNLTIRTGLWYYLKRGLYNDMMDMEQVVRDSGLNYVNLRPGLILIEPAMGNIKAAVDVDAPGQRVITYADFAAFILDAVESGDYDRTTVGVYSERPIEFGDNTINPEAIMARQKEINRQIREELAEQQ